MSDSQSTDHYFCFRCNRDLSFNEIDSDFLCNYCHEGFIERVPGPVPNRQQPPNVIPRIHIQGGPPPQMYPSLDVLRGVHISQIPNPGQSNPGGNNDRSGNASGSNSSSQTPGQGPPRAIRFSVRTGVPPPGLIFTSGAPPPPQPPGGQQQPQPNGLGAMFTNLMRQFTQSQRNPTPEGTNSNQGGQPGNQPNSGTQQQAGGNAPQNVDPFLNAFLQAMLNPQQQRAQQGNGPNVNRDQAGQPTGENQQQPAGGNTPFNIGQMFNTLFQFANPRNQPEAQQGGQNANQHQEGQQPGGENQQQQPAGGNIPPQIPPLLQALQTIINITQQPQQQQEGGQNANPNQGQPEMGMNFLDDLMQAFGDVAGGQPGDNANPQEQEAGNERQGGVNWMQLIQNLLPQGTEIRFQFNGVDVNNDQNIENLLNQLFNGAAGQRIRGISEEDLKRLPMTKVSQTHVDNEVQCVTCMEGFQLDEDVAELACKHIFHKACLVPWLQTRRTCPVCRAQVDPTTWPSAPPEEETRPTNSSFADMDELD